MPIYTPRFATNQLRHIGVLFLWHNAGACGICVGKLNEMEFMAAPEDDFLAEAAQVHHQDRKRGCQLNAEISVGNTIHAIHCDGGKAQFLRNGISIQRVGGGGKCAAAQRHYVCAFVGIAKAVVVALEHFHIRKQVMRQCNRLCALQVRIAG